MISLVAACRIDQREGENEGVGNNQDIAIILVTEDDIEKSQQQSSYRGQDGLKDVQEIDYPVIDDWIRRKWRVKI